MCIRDRSELVRENKRDRDRNLLGFLQAQVGAVVVSGDIQRCPLVSLASEEGVEGSQYIGLAGVVEASERGEVVKPIDSAVTDRPESSDFNSRNESHADFLESDRYPLRQSQVMGLLCTSGPWLMPCRVDSRGCSGSGVSRRLSLRGLSPFVIRADQICD